MIRAVLVDDEKKAIIALEKMLNKYCSEVSIVASSNQPSEAIELILQHQPDVVFLDIEMPVKSGFGLLDNFSQRNFSVIFTTAYNQYAIKAFRYSALDYLLKPIAEEELIAAVKRIQPKSKQQEQTQFQLLFDNLKNLNDAYSKITISTSEGLLFVNVSDIIYCEAESSYTTFYLKSKDKIVSSKTLKDYEEILLQHSFFRTHHSYLINLNEIKRYIKGEGGSVIMNNGSELPVAKRKKDEFLKRLKL